MTQNITHDDMRADAERAISTSEPISRLMLGQHILALLAENESLQSNPLNALDLGDYQRDIVNVFGGASQNESDELRAYLEKYIAPLCQAAQGKYDQLRAENERLRGRDAEWRRAANAIHSAGYDHDACHAEWLSLESLLAATEPNRTEG